MYVDVAGIRDFSITMYVIVYCMYAWHVATCVCMHTVICVQPITHAYILYKFFVFNLRRVEDVSE